MDFTNVQNIVVDALFWPLAQCIEESGHLESINTQAIIKKTIDRLPNASSKTQGIKKWLIIQMSSQNLSFAGIADALSFL